MTGVPSTPTASDRLAEVRKLNIEIAGLTSAKDAADRAAREAETACADAKARASGVEESLKALDASMAGAASDVREFVAYCRNILQNAVVTMELAVVYARDLQKHVDDLCREIEKSRKSLDALRDTIARENSAMSQTREDLNIYEERIRTAAEVVGIKVKL